MSDKIEKLLKKLSEKLRMAFFCKLKEIEEKGTKAGDIQPLKGSKGIYRLRFGKIRALFVLKEGELGLLDLDYRGQVYKNPSLDKDKSISFYEDKFENDPSIRGSR